MASFSSKGNQSFGVSGRAIVRIFRWISDTLNQVETLKLASFWLNFLSMETTRWYHMMSCRSCSPTLRMMSPWQPVNWASTWWMSQWNEHRPETYDAEWARHLCIFFFLLICPRVTIMFRWRFVRASPGRKCFFLDTRLKKCSPNLIRKVIFILIFVFFFSIKSISCRKKMVERGGWFTRGDDKEEVHDGSFCELLPSTYLDSSYIWIIIFLSFILDENFLERKRSDRQKMSWKQWRNGLDAEKRSSTRIFW